MRLARQLTSPLRRMQKTIERFGRGDFTARVNSRRADELGQLGRTVDQMAERIEGLLKSQRRLLQDISHELRSPLARLGVAVELARGGGDRRHGIQSHRARSRPAQHAGGRVDSGDSRGGRSRRPRYRAGAAGRSGAGDRFRRSHRGRAPPDRARSRRLRGGDGGQSGTAAPRHREHRAQRDPLFSRERTRAGEPASGPARYIELPFAILARACRKRRLPICSIRSTASRKIAAERAEASGWGWPSPSAPSNCITERCGHRTSDPGLLVEIELPAPTVAPERTPALTSSVS